MDHAHSPILSAAKRSESGDLDLSKKSKKDKKDKDKEKDRDKDRDNEAERKEALVEALSQVNLERRTGSITREFVKVNSQSMSNEEIEETASTLKSSISKEVSNLTELLDNDPELLDVRPLPPSLPRFAFTSISISISFLNSGLFSNNVITGTLPTHPNPVHSEEALPPR